MWPFLVLKRFLYYLPFLLSFAAISGCSTNSAMQLRVNSDGTFTDFKQNLVWQQDKSGLVLSPEEAESYVGNLALAGKSGWRLPTLAEFHNLYFTFDFGGKNKEKSSFKLKGKFWVKDKEGQVVVGAWDDVGESCCIVRKFSYGMRGYVKAVRSDERPGKQ